MKELLLKQLNNVERIASYSKLGRFINAPRKYLFGILYRETIYRFSRKGKITHALTFWGDSMTVVLPSSLDIYLTGGKSHDSEIRLCKFLINILQKGDHFLDIGSHYGFFSLLAAKCVGETGRVTAVEASKETYKILKSNTAHLSNIKTVNYALSDQNGVLEFLEFPVLYSEFNTLEKSLYENEGWYKNVEPKLISIDSIQGDKLIREQGISPKVIKIDVEGAEFRVIKGLREYLNAQETLVVMEFASGSRGNANHILAENLLAELHYSPYSIGNSGELTPLSVATSDYIDSLGAESDNIVYRKSLQS